jgi:hypothetical protein
MLKSVIYWEKFKMLGFDPVSIVATAGIMTTTLQEAQDTELKKY